MRNDKIESRINILANFKKRETRSRENFGRRQKKQYPIIIFVTSPSSETSKFVDT